MKISPNAQLQIQMREDGNPKIAALRWNRKPFAPR